jgi:hypothetical protein
LKSFSIPSWARPVNPTQPANDLTHVPELAHRSITPPSHHIIVAHLAGHLSPISSCPCSAPLTCALHKSRRPMSHPWPHAPFEVASTTRRSVSLRLLLRVRRWPPRQCVAHPGLTTAPRQARPDRHALPHLANPLTHCLPASAASRQRSSGVGLAGWQRQHTQRSGPQLAHPNRLYRVPYIRWYPVSTTPLADSYLSPVSHRPPIFPF